MCLISLGIISPRFSEIDSQTPLLALRIWNELDYISEFQEKSQGAIKHK